MAVIFSAGSFVYEVQGASNTKTKEAKSQPKEKTKKTAKKTTQPKSKSKKSTKKKVPKDDTGLTAEEIENLRTLFNELQGWDRFEVLSPGRYNGGINGLYPEEDESLITVIYPNSHSDVFYFGITYDLTWHYGGDGEPPEHFEVSLVYPSGYEMALDLAYRWDPATRTCNALWDVPTWHDRELPIYTGEYKIKVSAGTESDMSNFTFFLSDIELTVTSPESSPRTRIGAELIIRWDTLPTGFMLYGVGFAQWEAELINCATGERELQIIYPDFQPVTDLGQRSNGRHSYEYRWRLGAYPVRHSNGVRADGTYDFRWEWGGWEGADLEPGFYTVRLWPAGKSVPEIHIDSEPFYAGGSGR